MKRLNQQGFSMIELLVVLLIIGVLAAVAAPMFLANADKAKAAEAVAGVGSIRSAERVYAMQHSGAFVSPIAVGVNYFSTTLGVPADRNTSLGLNLDNAKYFSPASYTVVAVPAAGVHITNPVDFVVIANGANSVLKAGADANARAAGEVNNIRVEMDNSGAVRYSIDGGASYADW
ncbi:MAG: type II secretion system protein [Candidatus Omnitrophica bacterium]|nr:type II secretion system protein [Candidatus Omnitrophota bacterium]